MTYTVLRGRFVIRYPDLPRQGPQPDGDTVKFQPDTPALVEALPRPSGRPPDLNARGISVRLEAIDALETHFDDDHQELAGADAARDELLRPLGFTGVPFFADAPNKVESADQDTVRGHVLSNGIDANGRMIGFVYPGEPAGARRRQVFLDDPRVDASLNARLLTAGLVYPAFYDTLPADLRAHLAGCPGRPGPPAPGSGRARPPTRTARQRSRIWPALETACDLAQAVPPHRAVSRDRVSPTSTASTPGCARTRSTATTRSSCWTGRAGEPARRRSRPPGSACS